MKDAAIDKAKKIKIVICDVDGVLTNGSIAYGNYKDEYREFNVHDGFGFVLLKKAGIKTAVITSKSSVAVQRRAKELSVDMVCQNVKKKLPVFKRVLKRFRLKPEEACYIGDDLLDLAAIKNAGFSVSVPEAFAEIKASVDYITQKNAGSGAFRETAEFILKAQDKWPSILEYYSG
ncbi:MAG: HAD-IIIA family hydrolase [Candidatus Omnitrophica bacterium]|nr:HAD-IIIA family hydrolase [Candidatus Omnitrophota bacterium]